MSEAVSFEYGSESSFWYFFAHQVQADAEPKVFALLDRLNERADDLELPIAYLLPHAINWGVVCRLFIEVYSSSLNLSKFQYALMKLGFARALGPPGFVEQAFNQISANIGEPALPSFPWNDTVIDTFVTEGLRLYCDTTDRELLTRIVGTCLSDRAMHELGRRVCEPTAGLWDATVATSAEGTCWSSSQSSAFNGRCPLANWRRRQVGGTPKQNGTLNRDGIGAVGHPRCGRAIRAYRDLARLIAHNAGGSFY